MPLPINKVLEIIDKHSLLEKNLSEANLDSRSFAEKSKEYSSLNEIIKYALEYSNFEKNKNDLEKIVQDNSSDEEIRELAKLELKICVQLGRRASILVLLLQMKVEIL